MPKQPVEVEAPEEPLVEEAPAKGKGRATRARVTLEGDVPTSTLQRVIPGDSTFPDVPVKGKMSFSKAIRNTDWRIFAERLSPRQMPDGTPLEDVLEVPSYDSITENDVKKEIQQARGGTRWIARVVDVEDNNRVIATKLYVIGGEPIQEPSSAKSDQSGGRGGFGDHGNGFPEDDGESPEEVEARIASEIEADPQVREKKKQARIKELEIEDMRRDVERMKAEAEMRRIRDENKPPDAKTGNDDMRRAIEDATKPLREESDRLRKELDDKRRADDSQRNLDAHIAPLKAAVDVLTQKSNVPVQMGPTTQEILLKMDAMAASIKSDATAQIANAVEKMALKFEGQINNINTQLTALMNRPQDGGSVMSSVVNALTKIATDKEGGRGPDPFETTEKVFNLVKGARELTGGGPEGDVNPPDFPSYLVKELANLTPKVIEYLERKQGGPVNKEQVEATMKELGLKMYQELDRTVKSEIRLGMSNLAARQGQAPQRIAQPAPAPSGPFSPPPPGAPGARLQPGIPQAISPNAPPPSPEALPPTSVPVVQFGGGQPAPSPIVAPPPLEPMSADAALEAETRDRVNWILTMLLHEMKLGVQEMQWPEKAYGNLPKGVLDRIVDASTDKDVYDAISPYADPKSMEAIFTYVSESNPQHDFYREWLTAGVNWIKEEAVGGNESESKPGAPGTP